MTGNLKHPWLSIIVPVLDEQAGIAASLDALNASRQAARLDTELIVVDGISQDQTLSLARDRADVVIVSGRGRGRQLNAGAAQARGELLLFLHADTVLPPDAITLLAQAMAKNPDARWGRFDVRISGRSRMFPVIAALMNLRSAWTGIATGDQAMFVRRASFDAAGGFPDQRLMEDIELSCRLLRLPQGRPLRLRSKVTTSGRRWETRGVWATIWLMWRLRWRYWRGASPDELGKAYR
ncbi:MAG: TIGR04283 family arsenosugar biosynthesis glycosyltransferase [Ideonella sp.]